MICVIIWFHNEFIICLNRKVVQIISYYRFILISFNEYSVLCKTKKFAKFISIFFFTINYMIMFMKILIILSNKNLPPVVFSGTNIFVSGAAHALLAFAH